MSVACFAMLKSLSCRKRKFVVVRHGSKREGMKVPKVHKGQREPPEIHNSATVHSQAQVRKSDQAR